MDVFKFKDAFSKARHRSVDISKQNLRIERANEEISDPEFLNLALDGLRDEQIQTVDDLLILTANLPYEQLSEAYTINEIAIQSLDKNCKEAILSKHQVEMVAINSLCKLVSDITPNAAIAAQELATQRIEQILEHYHVEADRIFELEELKRLFEENGEAWELPILLNNTSAEIDDVLKVEETVKIKVNEQPIFDQKSNTELGKRRYAEIHASEMIAYYFKENQGKAIGADELSYFLYPEEAHQELGEKRLYSRVLQTINLGRRKLDSFLVKEGLELHLGWDKTGYARGKRLYMVLPAGKLPVNVYDQNKPKIIWENGITRMQDSEIPSEYTPISDTKLSQEIIELAKDKILLNKDRQKNSQKWYEFRLNLANSLTILISYGVLLDRNQPVKISKVKMLCPSKVVGTKTSIQRMINAKLLKRGTTEEHSISPDLVLAMYTFNSQRDLLQGTKQKKALEIISEFLDAGFKLKEQLEEKGML